MRMTEADQREDIIAGLPLAAWVEILRMVCDPTDVLASKQVDGTLNWARDRTTLAIEAEGVGKSRSVQIWRALEGMGCLSYED